MVLNALPATLQYTTLGTIRGTATDGVGISQIKLAIRRTISGVCSSWNGSSWDAGATACNAGNYPIVININPTKSYSLAYANVPPLAQMTDGATYRVYAVAVRMGTVSSAEASAGPTLFQNAQSPPSGSIAFQDATCASNIVGSATDADSPTTPLTVELLRNGIETGITTTTNIGLGGFFLFPSSVIPQNGVSYTYTAHVFGVDSTGTQAAPNTFVSGAPALIRTCAPAPTVTLTGPATVDYGTSAALVWSSTNATACTASGGWSGAKPTAMPAPGETSATLTAPTTFTLTCSNGDVPPEMGAASHVVALNYPPPTSVINSVEFSSLCNKPSPEGWFSWTYTSALGIPGDSYIFQIDTDQNEANGVVMTSTEQDIAFGSPAIPTLSDTAETEVRSDGLFVRLVNTARHLLAFRFNAPDVVATADAGFCDPFQNCFNDGQCDQGYCKNRVCQCDSPVPDVCADRCTDRGLCYPGQCGGNTVHIGDCRGIASGGRGGVISYCDQPPAPPPPPSGVVLVAAPSTIPAGGFSQLSWSSSGATSCGTSDGTPAWVAFTPGLSGSFGVNGLSSTTSFKITCTGPGGSADATETITVQVPTTPPPTTPTPTPIPGTPTSAVYSRTLPATLEFDTQYYIRIKAKGALTAMGSWSPYFAFGPAKSLPRVDFSYVPFPAVAEQEITFTESPDASYTGTPHRLWDFHDGNTVADVISVTKIFPSDGTYTVTLQVTDDNGTCWKTIPNISVDPSLPQYREVRPGPR
jgi:hypothetical protein